jgi:hypothetical protein
VFQAAARLSYRICGCFFSYGCAGLKLDLDTNCLNRKSSYFIPDVTAPTLASSLPAGGALVQQNMDIDLLVFSEPVSSS